MQPAGTGRSATRAQEEGYLFFKGLLPIAEVHDLRSQILEVCQRHGFLDDLAPRDDGIARHGFFTREADDDPIWHAYYCDILKLRYFHAMALHPNIVGVFDTLFGEPVLPLSCNIAMTIFPRNVQSTTPVHQDYAYIGGTEETWTTWIPCVDCPRELGGLAILPDSHARGPIPHGHYDANDTGLNVAADSVWAAGGLKCGDALIFKSTTLHQGVDNVSGNRIRLSVDFRYQPRNQPVRRDSMEPHRQWLSWEEIYSGWPEDDPVKHYWRDWELNIVDE